MLKKLVFSALGAMGCRPEQHPSKSIPEADDFENRVMDTAARYSQSSRPRHWSLIQSLQHVHHADIPGDVVECGVWQGANLILADLVLRRLGSDKTVWGYDTFCGMTEPTPADRSIYDREQASHTFEKLKKTGHVDWCYCPLETVQANIRAETGHSDVRLVKGRVEDTLKDPANLPASISVLRLDTDWYESTRLELELLFPMLSPGGVLIIDDYGHWQGARKAVDEYFKGRRVWLHRVDYTCRLVVKGK